MAKKRYGFIIPSDWNGTDYTLVAACVPDSPEWISLFKGCVYLLTRGYSYDSSTGTVTDAQAIGKEVYNSMSFCDQMLAALLDISTSIKLNSCGCNIGQAIDTEDGEAGGSVPPPVGDIVYQEPSAEPNRDCKAANLVHKTLRDLVVELASYNVDDMGALGLALVVGMVTGSIAAVVATPLAGVIVAVAGAIATFAARLVGVSVDLDSMATIMTSEGQALVCALYEATSASEARDSYLAECEAAGFSALESSALELIMTYAVMDVLFFDTPETAAFWPTYVPEFDCVSCGPNPSGLIWFTNLGTPYNGIVEGAYTVNYPSGWLNQGDAYDDSTGWCDDTDSSYPDTLYEIENPAYNRPDLANNPPELDRYWVTVRIDFTGYNGAWRFGLGNGFDAQSPTYGPGFSGGYFRSGKDTQLVSWIEWVAGLWIVDEWLGVTMGHGGDTNTSSGKLEIKLLSLGIEDDIYP